MVVELLLLLFVDELLVMTLLDVCRPLRNVLVEGVEALIGVLLSDG
jgi:hypothetical protein